MQLLHPYFNIFYTMKRIFFLILFPVFLSQTAFGSFFIQARQVVTRLSHHLYHLVEAHTMFPSEKFENVFASSARAAAKALRSIQGI